MTTPIATTMPNLGSYGSLYATQKSTPTTSPLPVAMNAGAADQTPPPSTALPGGIPQGTSPSAAISQILSMLTTILTALLSSLKGSGNALDAGPAFDKKGTAQSAGGASSPAQLDSTNTKPPAGGAAPANASALGAAAQKKNITTDPTQKQRLDATLGKIAQDPDGAKLLQKALDNGYKIQVGDPNGAPGSHDATTCPACKAAMDAGQQVNGVTIPGTKTIVINPNAPDFDKTVGHELVHAATEGDGNSQTEEGMADVMGYRISSRMNGTSQPGTEQQIFKNKIASYPNLNGSNDIMNSLKNLGIAP